MRKIERELLFEAVARHGRCGLTVGGYCMAPAIRNGARIVVERLPESGLKVGDVAAYFLGEKLFVHRLVSVEGGGLVFKADGPAPPPHTVPPGNILGRVKQVKNPNLLKRIFKKAVSWIKP